MSSEENTLYIGKKSTMNYVLVCVSMLNDENVDKIVIKARGRAISKAVDVAEIVSRRFFPDKVAIDEVKIDSEELTNNGTTRTVSTIDIILKKK